MKTNKLKKGKLYQRSNDKSIYKYHGIGKDGRHYFTPIHGEGSFALYDKDYNSDAMEGRFSLQYPMCFYRYRNRPTLASTINTIKKFFNK